MTYSIVNQTFPTLAHLLHSIQGLSIEIKNNPNSKYVVINYYAWKEKDIVYKQTFTNEYTDVEIIKYIAPDVLKMLGLSAIRGELIS